MTELVAEYLSFYVFLSLAIRSRVGLWDYSGFSSPPMFGDFEAQRHWMEVTVALPIGDW